MANWIQESAGMVPSRNVFRMMETEGSQGINGTAKPLGVYCWRQQMFMDSVAMNLQQRMPSLEHSESHLLGPGSVLLLKHLISTVQVIHSH
jgi:hypothetical protein